MNEKRNKITSDIINKINRTSKEYISIIVSIYYEGLDENVIYKYDFIKKYITLSNIDTIVSMMLKHGSKATYLVITD